MPKRDDVRPVVYLDTNSLHYLDLFVRYVQDNGFTVDDIGSEALVKKLEQVDEVGYRQSLQKGRRIISFVVTVVSARWFGGDALELTCRGPGGELGSEILYRDDEARPGDGRAGAAVELRRRRGAVSAGVRGAAAAAAAALPAGRRSRRRQDDHDRTADEGTDRPRRPAALPGGVSRQPGRAVAG